MQKKDPFYTVDDTYYDRNYPAALTLYSDDGWRLSAPERYSISDWFVNLVNIPQSQILYHIKSHLIFNFLWASGITALCYIPPDTFAALELGAPPVFDKLNLYLPFAMSSGILGVLLAFRTGQAYDRFWEGRQIWAHVVGRERSLARCLRYLEVTPDIRGVAASPPPPLSSSTEPSFSSSDSASSEPSSSEPAAAAAAAATAAAIMTGDPFVDRFGSWLVAFPVALMQHLRGERSLAAFNYILDEPDIRFLEGSDNLPIACLTALTDLLKVVKTDKAGGAGGGSSSSLLWWQMEEQVTQLMSYIGEAEAIAGTPVPLAYSRHTSRLLSLWTILSPIVFLQCLPPLAVPLVTLILSWMLIGTEEIGHIIEEPFGIHDDRPNILPLQRYCDIVAKDVREVTQSRYEARLGPLQQE